MRHLNSLPALLSSPSHRLTRRHLLTCLTMLCLGVVASGCRHDEYVSMMTEAEIHGHRPTPSASPFAGLYVLCEGNMGSNKCTLDYLDLNASSADGSTLMPSARYLRNIYAERNPSTVLELGDVGNDLGIYGSRLWMTINCSNKVEVCQARSARRIGQVQIANCRYLAFDGGFAYVSSYAGPVQIGTDCPLGRVYKVDTLTLQRVDSVTVGYQPEEMAIGQGKLYVANSGGYRVPFYDDRISIIDLSTFSVIGEWHVGINLHRLAIDPRGTLWVSSRGDYGSQSPALHWIAPDGTHGQLDCPVSAFSMAGDSLYCIGSSFSYATGTYVKDFALIDTRLRQRVADTHLFDAPQLSQMTMPYSIIVNPQDRDFYLMDAHNFVSSGRLLHFLPDGTFDWEVRTGDIPSAAAFVRKL